MKWYLLALCVFLSACAKPLPVLGELPDFSLQNQFGEKVKKGDLADKIWVADFIYSGCSDVCPRLTQKMKGVGEAFIQFSEVRLVSFSVDPEVDTPARLKAYSESFGADPKRWIFLTGPLGDLEKTVVAGFKLSMGRSAPSQVFHSEKFVLVDRQGRIRGYYDANEDGGKGLEDLKKGIAKLLKEGL